MAVFTLLLSVEAEAISHPALKIPAAFHKTEVAGKKEAPKPRKQQRNTRQSANHKNNNRNHRTHSKNAGSHKITTSLAPASYSIAWNLTGQENQFRTHPYCQYKGEIISPPPRFA